MPAMNPPAASTVDNAALARRFFLGAALVLVAGLVPAVYVYWKAVDDGTGAVLDQMSQGKDYHFQLERMGGRAMVLMADFNDWFSSLWHGKPLAYVLAGTSMAIALACCLIGRRLSQLARADAARAP